MVAVFKWHVPVNDAPLIRRYNHHIRFNHPGWVNDDTGPDPTVMPNTAPQHILADGLQRSIPINGPDWCWDQIKVCKCIPRPNERIPPDHTHLQTCILGNHAILH